MYKYLKRMFDILISVMLLPFVSVIIVIFAVIIKLEDGGSVFYNSRRIGKDRNIFKMYKLRTMIENAPDYRDADGSTLNSPDDDRVTRIGKIMRKTSIDELPQIFNIIKGDMSLVGPRPDSAMWVDNYTEEEKIIHTVRPGITGYNQATSRNLSTTKEKLKKDIYYVENLSFKLDIYILIWTVKSVLLRKNIYRDAE